MSSSPPGPKGEPLFGSSRRYARDPFRFLSACEQAYGDVVQFDLGPIPTYLLTDPADVERVLVSEADRYRKPDFQDDALGDLLGKGLLLSEGQTWREQRELANPAFSPGRVTGFVDDIVSHSDDLLADWADGAQVDVERDMTEVTLAVIVDLMLGTDLNDRRVRTIREALEPLGARFEPDPVRFAAPQWLPMPGDGEYRSAVETMETVIDDIVAERRGTHGDPESDEGPDDLLSILLRARDRGEQSDTQIRDEVMTMLLAGHDTTALTLTYAWYLLSQHPDAERRVHDELDDVLGGDPPTMADVRRLDYVERVVDEAMRLYPPVYTMFREPKTDAELGGYRIPEGSAIMLSQWAMHRSERYWDRPDSFDPDRWTRETDRPRFAYFPFGGGPRHCIGKHLAKLEATLILARTGQRYRLEYLGDREPELLPSLTMHPRNGMPMRVRER
ncbi:cytochrome P450 (plasmid) [Halorussus salilacus]|uniref:cytochrome P450 n=1 Tax=Halorussus salilacus TaxID=2953750 RepID=UPI0020A211F2|nr:cytochrome P450 [Halorussus salilacus]USZ70003.1 cytochrome P450 [Halorussus salilacus]